MTQMREAIIADNFPSWVSAYCEKNYSGKLTVKFKHALKPVNYNRVQDVFRQNFIIIRWEDMSMIVDL